MYVLYSVHRLWHTKKRRRRENESASDERGRRMKKKEELEWGWWCQFWLVNTWVKLKQKDVNHKNLLFFLFFFVSFSCALHFTSSFAVAAAYAVCVCVRERRFLCGQLKNNNKFLELKRNNYHNHAAATEASMRMKNILKSFLICEVEMKNQ